MKRCKARHPIYTAQVRCVYEIGHDGAHFDSFFMRSWDTPTFGADNRPPPVKVEQTKYPMF